jgi:hypothetical protein
MDVHLISLLWNAFVLRGYVDDTKLLAQSSRYITMHKSVPPPGGHPLLPLEILETPPVQSTILLCGTCSRDLSSECFPIRGDYTYDTTRCWICLALNARLESQERVRKEAESGGRKARRHRYTNADLEWAIDSYDDWYRTRESSGGDTNSNSSFK